MRNKLINFIKNNKLPSLFIVLTIMIAILMGVSTAYFDAVDYDLDKQGELKQRKQTNSITYHHTGVSDRPITSHHDYHTDNRDWIMVGYHYYIRKDGTVEQGRPHKTVGSHAGAKANSQSIGIALSGNMNKIPPTKEQYESIAKLHVWLEEQYKKDLKVYGHKHWMNTDCPGKYTNLDKIKELIQEERSKDDNNKNIDNSKIIKIKGEAFGNTGEGYLIKNRVYVPLRFVGESMDADVIWYSEEKRWEVK